MGSFSKKESPDLSAKLVSFRVSLNCTHDVGFVSINIRSKCLMKSRSVDPKETVGIAPHLSGSGRPRASFTEFDQAFALLQPVSGNVNEGFHIGPVFSRRR